MPLPLSILFGLEPKDYLTTLMGFGLGYMASLLQARYDRFKSITREAARSIDSLHAKARREPNTYETASLARIEMTTFSLALRLEGHTQAAQTLGWIITEISSEIIFTMNQCRRAPSSDPRFANFDGDIEGFTNMRVSEALVLKREKWMSAVLAIKPDIDAIIPFSRKRDQDDDEKVI